MENFFRRFRTGIYHANGENGAFHSLWEFVRDFGMGVYGLVLQLLIILLLIFTSIAFLKGYLAQGAPQKQEAKSAIERNIVVLVLCVSLTALIIQIYRLFTWA